jgi:hypothetical protein
VTFDRLFREAVPLLLAGEHQRDVPPVDGGRWPVGVLLTPEPAVAARLDAVTTEAVRFAGPGHFRTGALDLSHFTVRALEYYRHDACVTDPFVRRCAVALRSAAARCAPVALRVTGLTLTAGTVMASAVPLDDAAWRLMDALREELGEDGWHEADFRRDIWYVNLLHFTGPVADPAGLVSWVAERRDLDLGSCLIEAADLVRFVYDAAAGMRPVLFERVPLSAVPGTFEESRSHSVGAPS